MIFPLYLILLPYGLILVFFIAFSLFNIFHLVHYGFWKFSSALFVLCYLFVSAAWLLWTYQALTEVDWQMPITQISNTIDFGPESVLP